MLLILEESPYLSSGYYRLLDSLARDVKVDRKLGTAEETFGHYVQRLLVERYKAAMQEGRGGPRLVFMLCL